MSLHVFLIGLACFIGWFVWLPAMFECSGSGSWNYHGEVTWAKVSGWATFLCFFGGLILYFVAHA